MATIWDLVINENNAPHHRRKSYISSQRSVSKLLLIPLLQNLKFFIEGQLLTNPCAIQAANMIQELANKIQEAASLQDSAQNYQQLLIFHRCPDNTQHAWQKKTKLFIAHFCATFSKIDPNFSRSEDVPFLDTRH